MKTLLQTQLNEIKSVFRSPTLKQKESHGRICQTLCSVSFVGAVSVTFTETHATLYIVGKIVALIFWGVVLFLASAVLNKGE
jgi:hypothetical protein